MKRKNFEQAFSVIQKGVKLGIISLSTEKGSDYPRSFNHNNKSLVNFSLCDYMGLSTDKRLKEGAIKAIEKYGPYTPVSRIYFKMDIYDEAEEYLAKVFNKPVVIFQRTTLVHLGIIPILIDSNDAVILDHQVHTSVRVATDLLRASGNYVETIRHNRIDLLEERIKELKVKYSKIWYLADGVYSMYGDTLPAIGLTELMNKYEQFHVYVDDAHGMSWFGENGQGYVLNNMPFHPQMIFTTSLGKGYGAGGGVVVCHDEETKRWITTCAASLIFTSPVYPPTLGAIIESAKIHLTTEIYKRQADLQERVQLLNTTATSLELPVLSSSTTPIFFLATGQTEFCNEVCLNLVKRGFYLSPAQYPAVPINNSGVRATITLNQTLDDITSLVYAIKEEYDNALKKKNMKLSDILKYFKTEKQPVC